MTSLQHAKETPIEEEKSDLYEQLHQSGGFEDEPPVYQNAPPRRRTFTKSDWKDMPDRFIITSYPDYELPDNSIQTTKYNVMNFIPKNLMEQFSKLANVYFLVIGVLQAIGPISTSNGKPVIYFPLAVILLVSAIKDLVEDLKRRNDDKKENFGKSLKLTPDGFVPCKWMDIRVGDIVKVQNNEYIPADMILLKTSEANGTCFTETKNLDGETNLKPRVVDKALLSYFHDDQDLLSKRLRVNYERPNPYLYTFRGNLKLQNGKEIPLTNNNFLLRACSLKSTYAIGLVAYTGHETKIMLNSVSARGKSSKLERMMNKQIILVFIMQNVLCFVIAIYATIWNIGSYYELDNYLKFTDDYRSSPVLATLGYFIMKYGNWLVIFTNFVPISLLVTLEMVKFIQAQYVTKDPKMVDDVNGTNAAVQTSRLMEELGQVNYIFSDKTGTLTCNIMEFKKLCIMGETYGDNRSYDHRKQPTVTNVDFVDSGFFEVLRDPGHGHFNLAHEILLLLSTCHSINIDESKGTKEYSASSPDELALVNFAKYCNYEYIGKTEKDGLLLKVNGKDEQHKLLHMLEFDSDRKRMSVILETARGEIVLYCKGADSIIIDRMCKNSNDHIKKINEKVEEYANVGLRTLLVAKRVLNRDTYNAWDAEYHKACSAIKDREKEMAKLQEEIEKDLIVIGATAIEDKLQDNVGETIYSCREAGMKVWVLTGDKTETAINIGHSCKLLDHSQKIFIIDVESPEQLSQRIVEVENEAKHRIEVERGAYALVITGKSLIYSHHGGENGELSNRLYNIFSKADAVVACRVSPKQKRDIVELVKSKVPEAVTLAIGDGANDVNMITAAHIGVGIKGLEGYQAARASDFAIGEFKLLRRLLLFYGRESYRKNSVLVLYNFFKNQVLILPQFWYGFMNGFSGTSLYEPFIFQLYNICYASLPIVVFAVGDKEFNGSFLERNPKYYRPGLQDNYFNMKLFWRWFSAGSIQAIVIVATAFLSMSTNFVNEDGYTVGFFSSGMTAYSSLIICANLKILLFSNTINVLNLFLVFGSFFFYIGNFAILSTQSWSANYGEFMKIYGTWNYYLGTGAMIGLTTLLDLAISRFRFSEVMSTDKTIELQIRKQSMKRSGNRLYQSDSLYHGQSHPSRNFSIMQEEELSL